MLRTEGADAPLDVQQVLEHDRQSVQRPHRQAGGLRRIGCPGEGARRIVKHLGEGMQRVFGPIDAGKISIGDLERARFLAVNEAAKICERVPGIVHDDLHHRMMT